MYARVAYVDSDGFANRATDALRDDAVRTLAAERVTDDIVLERRQDLLAARPLIEGVVSGAIGSRAFTDLFRAGVRDAHRALVLGDAHTLTLTLADAGSVVAAALDVLKPSIAADVRSTGAATLLDKDLGTAGSAFSAAAGRAKLLAVVLTLLWIAVTAAAVLTARARHRAVA